jgi:hypothetical protein
VAGGEGRRGASGIAVRVRESNREREKAAGKLPHHNVVLRGRSIDDGRQRSGGAAAARDASGKATAATRVRGARWLRLGGDP